MIVGAKFALLKKNNSTNTYLSLQQPRKHFFVATFYIQQMVEYFSKKKRNKIVK